MGQDETPNALLVFRFSLIGQVQVNICIELVNLFNNMGTKSLGYSVKISNE